MTDHFEEDREQLRSIQTIFERAVEKNTLEDIKEYIDSDFSIVSFTDKSFGDFDSFNKEWKITRQNIVGRGGFTTKLNPEPSLFIDDMAICKGRSDNTMLDNKGQHFEYTSNWTVIFKRTDGIWKILRAHSSLDPFRNPVLVSNVKRKILISSLLAFIMGSVTCSVVGYWILQ